MILFKNNPYKLRKNIGKMLMFFFGWVSCCYPYGACELKYNTRKEDLR